MSDWYLSTPVWGDFNRRVFARRAVHSYLGALKNLGAVEVRWIIHTDQPGFVDRELDGYPVTYVPIVPDADSYGQFRACHVSILRDVARAGDWVSLLNADFIVSNNFFVRIKERLSGGYKAVVALGMRTVWAKDSPPISVDPRALLSWGWDHKHEVIRESLWECGRSPTPTHIFFEQGESVVARSFQLQPVGLVNDHPIEISTSIDGETLERFPFHVVGDPDDLAFIEMSKVGKFKHFVGGAVNVDAVAKLMRSHYMGAPLYRWQFGHRIVIKGDGSALRDVRIAHAILGGGGNCDTLGS